MAVIAILGIWLGSLYSGWINQPLWLLVPLLWFGAYAVSKILSDFRRLKEFGSKGTYYLRTMIIPTFGMLVWNSILNAVIFGFARLLAIYLGR
jgi:membrane protein required for beta-lactamase induction